MTGTRTREPNAATRLPDELLDTVCRSLGLTPADHVVLGVRRAMARAAVRDATEYLRLLDTDESALPALITELTVGETYFLREIGQFDFIRREVLPGLAAESGSGRSITAWSAGCASGEEAYSLAMIAQEANPPLRIRVLGTDIAESRLALARNAVYGEWSLRGVPETIVQRYFHRTSRKVRVAPAIRSMVEFRELNLASADWSRSGIAPRGMDLILCRNVLIYFDPATIARVAAQLIDSLSENGWLVLGASDPALTDLVSCEVVVTGSGLAYRRSRKSARTFPHTKAAPNAPPLFDRTCAPPVPPSFSGLPALPLLEARGAEVEGGERVERRDGAGDSTKRARGLLARTREEYLRGDYPRAVDLARECVTQDGHDAESWIILVRALANLGLNEEAGLACAAGLDLHRTSPELTYMHAMLLRQSARNVEALAALRCALYLDRQFVVAHLAIGDVLSAMGDRTAARQAFRNAERLLLAASQAEVVPGSDGLHAGRLLAVAQMQLGLLDKPTRR